MSLLARLTSLLLPAGASGLRTGLYHLLMSQRSRSPADLAAPLNRSLLLGMLALLGHWRGCRDALDRSTL